MLRKFKIYLILSLFIVAGGAYCDSQYVFSNSIVDTQQQSLSLLSPITVSKTYSNFSNVTQKLQELGFSVTVASVPTKNFTNVYISSNTTVKDFLNLVSSKFGYSWSNQGNTITFTAINPATSTQTISPKPPVIIVSKSAGTSSNGYPSRTNIQQTPPPQVWSLKTSDRKLRNALSKWCKQAGWQLVWNTKVDYDITTNWLEIPGSFESAVNKVLIATQGSDTPLYAVMYDSNRVLEIRSNDN